MADKPTYKKRSKRSYVAAAKKAVATRKKNTRGVAKSSPTAKKKTRRRTPAKPKGMLSELWNPKMAEAGGRALFSGAVGGASVGLVDKFMVNQTPIVRNVTKIALSFVAATVLKMPNVGAGMAGATINNAMQESGMLADNGMYLQDHNYATPIEQLPMVLNEDGTEMYLQEGDEEMYLEEDEDGTYGVGYFPDFGQA